MISSMQGDKDEYSRSEYGPLTLSIKVNALNLDFFMTCQACPEQYDVFVGDASAGYVRLRDGILRAAYPDVMAEYGYMHLFPDAWKGCFADDNERDFYLEQVAQFLYNEYMKSETVR